VLPPVGQPDALQQGVGPLARSRRATPAKRIGKATFSQALRLG
jgi:hypothetical protein